MPRNYYSRDPRWNDLRYATTCAGCGREIKKGERAFYFPSTRGNYCHTTTDGGEGCGIAADRRFESEAADEYAMGGF